MSCCSNDRYAALTRSQFRIITMNRAALRELSNPVPVYPGDSGVGGMHTEVTPDVD
jgi:hypothetical protein